MINFCLLNLIEFCIIYLREYLLFMLRRKMKYFIVTYGCQMNVHESEKIAGILEGMGYECGQSREDADIIVFNTCAIREGAEDRVFGNVGNLKKQKKQNPNLIIVVCGCMTQKEQTASYLLKTFPFVDIVIGTFNLPNLAYYINAVKSGRQKDIWQEGDIDETQPYSRSSGDNAWVNIMQGCNNFCTYCIVPYVRGREKSRKEESILNEIKALIAEGNYKKFTLLGQNVNSYGNDLSDGVNFAKLLRDICRLDGDFTVSFMTSHPKDLSDELIDTIATEPKVEKYIHLPAQSGDNRILKLMNRKYTHEKYEEIIDKIIAKIPNCRITSDFIVGFPTETEEEFMRTMELVEKVRYDSIFAFMYSPREGTVASQMEGQIDEKVKHERVNKLLALSKKIQKEDNKS